MTDLRYPIGRFQRPASISAADRQAAIQVIATAAAEYKAAVSGWTDEQLDTPYRPDGWTVRQLLHHVPESHMNSFIRFKLALTESEPTIKPYDEDAWARLPDATHSPVDAPLQLMEALHECWARLLRSMTEEQWERQFVHPDNGVLRLDMNLLIYAWHTKHHLAHITGLRDRMGWK